MGCGLLPYPGLLRELEWRFSGGQAAGYVRWHCPAHRKFTIKPIREQEERPPCEPGGQRLNGPESSSSFFIPLSFLLKPMKNFCDPRLLRFLAVIELRPDIKQAKGTQQWDCFEPVTRRSFNRIIDEA
jgi:hypothetical protein